ncbi:MAG: lhgO [Magnetococcales bacterium]|nr:lhgO [Magnetococcales bacterium]HIJ84624.1 L-2-hydroxyglutarate oxidase [Magnetococcales bacterium]
MSHNAFDFVIVGAGIVGLTVADVLMGRFANSRIAVLDKEAKPALHASGRNSGVMHCGIYYGSDTLKARVCSVGARRMQAFALENGIAYSRSGKVILATSEEQLSTIERLLKNARDNGISAERIDQHQLHEIEPYAAIGPAAIHCPDTAVIDGLAVVEHLYRRLEKHGVRFFFNCRMTGLRGKGQINTSQGLIHYGFLYNCAGAHADTVAKSFGLAECYALVPFKGIYWKLSANANSRVRANIYPVPDVSLPFLGVHLTRVINGDVYVGPTAIPAFGRENYGKFQWTPFSEAAGIAIELMQMYMRNESNFRTLAHTELAKYWKKNFLAAARRLVPSLEGEDMIPTSKVGIRPQLVNTRTRTLEMDYIILRGEDSLHVLNAISPALTSSFAFSQIIVDTGCEIPAWGTLSG